ncbi:SDR family oxidoreductase [Phytohabitans sp. ZYX-F-186]|uniref:SDR family oxidoreductase n=1 Tax=Phytohabitans maris TaxID=3071409 RepID=A0ABU0ZGI1_9ACTN|nr:SDR family oxidoreductase [Phytohabitans sp. ZYX-F-186]MDQ7905556.1 SDR family oxidoreductase [Phytohabitans sp. ZYX-F-186]
MTGVLSGRIAVVTGAASGFGAATALRFHAEGARVVVADRDGDGVKRVAEALGGDALGMTVDVSRTEDVARMVEAAVDTFGGLDILVNNAGIIHAKGSIETLAEAEFDRIVDVNLRGTFLGIKHAVPVLRRSRHAVILNTASVGALVPRINTSIYSATKAGIISLTRSAALDLAPAIRVNAVCPLASATPFLAGGAGGGGAVYDAYVAGMTSDARHSVPLGRLVRPEEVAAAFTFLASDDAAFITGVALPIDGGRSAGDLVSRGQGGRST